MTANMLKTKAKVRPRRLPLELTPRRTRRKTSATDVVVSTPVITSTTTPPAMNVVRKATSNPSAGVRTKKVRTPPSLGTRLSAR